jgi:Hypothetical glycosyl hydrolase 6/Beta-galactosidase trimerisation domain
MPYRKIHLDLHTSEDIPEAFSDFDAKAYVATLVKARADCVAFFANCHFGNCYYNTSVGHKHKGLKADYLGECTQEAKKHGLTAIAYQSIVWQDWVAKAHPDWLQRDAEGHPVEHGNWEWLCMNSPMRDFIYAQQEEILRQYPVDGFFFDITYIAGKACYCEHCQAKYETLYCEPMPRPFPDDEAQRFAEFRRQTRRDFLKDACRTIRAIKPDAQINWNHAGDMAYSALEADESATSLMQEAKHPEYGTASFHCKWMRNFGKPFEPMTSIFHYPDWSGFSLKDETKLRYEASTAIAHGGTCSFGDVGSPKGTLSKATYDVVGRVFAEVEAKEEWVRGAKSVPDIAVLHSVANMRLETPLRDHDTLLPNLDLMRGCHKVFTEGHRQFDIISEKALAKLPEYSTLVLSNQRFIGDQEAEAIRAFVSNGGKLIATYETGMLDEKGQRLEQSVLADLFGVSYHGVSDFAISYISDYDAISQGIPPMPIVVRSPANPQTGLFDNLPAVLVRPEEGARLAGLTHGPDYARDQDKVCHVSPYPAVDTGYAAVVHNRYGRGECVYFAHSLFTTYWRDAYTPQRKLILNALDLMKPNAFMRVDAPATVEAIATQRPGQIICHLLNYHGDKLGSECRFSAATPVAMEEVIPIHNIQLRLRCAAQRVFLPLREQELEFSSEGEHTVIALPRLDLHEIIVIE